MLISAIKYYSPQLTVIKLKIYFFNFIGLVLFVILIIMKASIRTQKILIICQCSTNYFYWYY